MTLRNLNIAPRAALSFSLITLLLIILGVIAIIQMGKLRDSELDVENNWMASVRQTGRIDSDLLLLRLESLRASKYDAQTQQASRQTLLNYRDALNQAIRAYEPLVGSPEEREIYQQVISDRNAYFQPLETLFGLLQNHSNEEAALFLATSIRPKTDALASTLERLAAFNDQGAAHAGEDAAHTYSTSITLVACIIIIAAIMTTLLAWLFTRSITTPLSQAQAVADYIASNNLSVPVIVNGDDEPARLLKALAKMQENLQNTIRHIADASTQLASAAEEMNAVTEESSHGLQRQNVEIEQASTAVNEMSAAVDEVARNAGAASDSAKTSERFTVTGHRQVNQTVEAIRGLSGHVETTSGQIHDLASQTQNISKVLDVIRGVAEQTNLLALNAAIEAARAGEQGRGFAVVADEVRALAHRTQQSTQEIEIMIVAIQNGSEQAVQGMRLSNDLAHTTLEVAIEAREALNQIANAITDINDRNLLIATASEEQAQVAREVDRNLISIRDLSIQTSAGANQTAAASGEVSRLAVGLNNMVVRFTL